MTDFIPLKPYRAFPSLPAVGGDLVGHSVVLREIREAVEQHERRRGDPLDSFVRIRELIDTGVLAQLGDRVVKADDTIFGGELETEFAQDSVGNILTDSSSINFTYDDSTPSISAIVIPGGVDHDLLANYVANEHVDHTAVTLTAGAGLTGGGDISANRTFAVGAGTGITVNADDVALSASTLAALALALTAVQPGDLETVAFSGLSTDLLDTANIAYLDRDPQTFTGENTFGADVTINGALDLNGTLDVSSTSSLSNVNMVGQLTITNGGPRIIAVENDAAADNQRWDFLFSAEQFRARVINDADSASFPFIVIDRTGIVVDEFEMNATAFDINGTVDLSSTLAVAGDTTITSTNLVLQSTSGAIIRMRDTDAAANLKRWRVRALDGTWLVAGEDDSGTQIEQAIGVTKASDGTIALVQFTGDEVDLTTALMDFNGVVDLDSSAGVVALDVGGGYVNITGSSTSGTIGLMVNNALPRIALLETDAAANNQLWYVHANAERFNIAAVDDARAAPVTALFIDRTGTTIDLVRIDATEFEVNGVLDFNGAADFSSTVVVNGAVTINALSALTLSDTSGPILRFTDGDATSGARNFRVRGVNTQFIISTENDANTLVENILRVTVNGSSEVTLTEILGDEIDLTTASLDINATATDISGTLQVNSTSTFTGRATFTQGGSLASNNSAILLTSTIPQLELVETGVTANNSRWYVRVDGEQLVHGVAEDTGSANSAAYMRVDRTATVIDSVRFDATLLDVRANLTLTGSALLTGVVSPAALAAGDNDNIDLGVGSVVRARLTGNAVTSNLTGVTNIDDGRLLILTNEGANTIMIINEDAGSTAAHRFAINGDMVLPPNCSALFIYDGAIDRWTRLN